MRELPPSSPNQEPTDDQIIAEAMDEADATDRPISSSIARMVGSQFHGGAASALYSFTSTGAIDLDHLRDEFITLYADPHIPETEKDKLDHLSIYLLEHGDRDPVPNWHELWGHSE